MICLPHTYDELTAEVTVCGTVHVRIIKCFEHEETGRRSGCDIL